MAKGRKAISRTTPARAPRTENIASARARRVSRGQTGSVETQTRGVSSIDQLVDQIIELANRLYPQQHWQIAFAPQGGMWFAQLIDQFGGHAMHGGNGSTVILAGQRVLENLQHQGSMRTTPRSA